MYTIMDNLQTKELSLLEDGFHELDDEDFHRILVGGDQLTVVIP